MSRYIISLLVLCLSYQVYAQEGPKTGQQTTVVMYCYRTPHPICTTIAPKQWEAAGLVNCYPNCTLPEATRRQWVDERVHRTLTQEAIWRDHEIIQDLISTLVIKFKCPDVRLIPLTANPASNANWAKYNQIWHRVYPISICGRWRFYKWVRKDEYGENVFRDETDAWRDGIIPKY